MRLLPFALALFALGCARNEPMPFELTPAEIRQARDLAEALEPLADLRLESPQMRIVFIKAERLPGAEAASGERQVMLQHYRYRDDTTVFTHIDLNLQEVVKQELAAHYPTGLSEEETRRALELARSDDRLRTIIEAQDLRLVPRPLQTLEHHRVVQLLLQRGTESLVEPRVRVDLTEERVIVGD